MTPHVAIHKNWIELQIRTSVRETFRRFTNGFGVMIFDGQPREIQSAEIPEGFLRCGILANKNFSITIGKNVLLRQDFAVLMGQLSLNLFIE